ncbi:hypothetical protein BI347_10045 [Chromobacterium sphagni]|uniref:Uncharacterized protein n=1 Tax=Chromobacterium sphagni TaxID=1903179 RepID=A0A1S1X2T1_9NEIS|nr:hypothetical protein BI347_10045 [Chromobacterium sphagni]
MFMLQDISFISQNIKIALEAGILSIHRTQACGKSFVDYRNSLYFLPGAADFDTHGFQYCSGTPCRLLCASLSFSVCTNEASAVRLDMKQFDRVAKRRKGIRHQDRAEYGMQLQKNNGPMCFQSFYCSKQSQVFRAFDIDFYATRNQAGVLDKLVNCAHLHRNLGKAQGVQRIFLQGCMRTVHERSAADSSIHIAVELEARCSGYFRYCKREHADAVADFRVFRDI